MTADYERLIEWVCKRSIEKLGDSIVSLVLYGSWARGDAKATSDIDLLAILEAPPREYYERLRPFLGVSRALEQEPIYKRLRHRGLYPYFSYLVLSKDEAMENRYIFLDMLEDAQILYDKGNFFQSRLQKLEKRLTELGSKRVFLEDGSWYWDLKPDLKPGEIFEL